MQQSGYQANRIKKNGNLTIKKVTSFTIVNDGDTDLTVGISGVSRLVKPNFQWEMQADFTHSDYEIEFSFAGGTGSAILDYKQLKC